MILRLTLAAMAFAATLAPPLRAEIAIQEVTSPGGIKAWLVEDKSIEPHIPVFDKSARNDGSFERADFVYDHDDDSYICPGGNRLGR